MPKSELVREDKVEKKATRFCQSDNPTMMYISGGAVVTIVVAALLPLRPPHL